MVGWSLALDRATRSRDTWFVEPLGVTCRVLLSTRCVERSEARLEASAHAGVSVPEEYDHLEADPTPSGARSGGGMVARLIGTGDTLT